MLVVPKLAILAARSYDQANARSFGSSQDEVEIRTREVNPRMCQRSQVTKFRRLARGIGPFINLLGAESSVHRNDGV